MNTRTDASAPLELALAEAVAETPSRAARPLRHLLERMLRQVRCGSITVTLPHGDRLEAQGHEPGRDATLVLHRWRPLWKLALKGDLGLAESWRDGDWSTPDLTALIEFGARNEAAWGDTLNGSRLARALARLAHLARANTRRGSRHNIAYHYDLGNHFYAQWLDASMLYSSALYPTGLETLEQAQAHRLDRIVELLDTPAGGKVLEIGCGWGTLAATLAERHQAHVTGLTLSTEQWAHARALGQQRGVADRLDLRLQDYRDVEGQYDRIVSIEMIEAVGEAWWPTYFQVLRDRLKPGGRVVLQAITIDEAYFDRYRRGADFIQRYIFPGGMLPTVSAMQQHAARAGLRLATQQRFGPSYARTLADWRQRFLAAWPTIEPLGFDAEFKRLWEYYLCYCEAGFNTGRIDVGLYAFEPAD
jgi:cyclopropane-fatty-acyl-phospholipid synthase